MMDAIKPEYARVHGCFLVAILGGLLTQSAGAENFTFHHENVMGTSLELQVRSESLEAARGAERRVLDEIDRLSAIFSNYDPNSEFRRWQASGQGPVKISPELLEMLRLCDRWQSLSDGAFDPRVQVLTRLWSRCAAAGRLPTEAELTEARETMRPPVWQLHADSGTAERLTECPLSLDAIAKGAIVEQACEAARKDHPEVRGLLLNVGGDLRVCGDLTGEVDVVSPWTDSETATPLARVVMRNGALATSGKSQRGFEILGNWYSHIFDPRSGQPAGATAGATVIAGRSTDADALATILNVLTPREGLRLVSKIPGAECLIVGADGRLFPSAGWNRYAKPLPQAATRQGESWGDDHEVFVQFTINRPDTRGERYRRPFVSVWIADENGYPVRNLVLWVVLTGSGPQEWLPDLKRWYRGELARRKAQKTDMVRAISRPTRPPGTYTVVWDGKNDLGQPVGPGKYTLMIEAAREHGTYQVIRKDVNLPTEPFTEELKGNVEIKSATVGYRRKQRREVTGRRRCGDAGSARRSPRSSAGCIRICRCSRWRHSCSSASPASR